MKKMFIKRHILFGLFLTLFFHSGYSQGLSLALNPPSVMLREYSYTVTIRVSNFNNVNAFQFDVLFNTAMLELATEPSASFLGISIASNTVDQANANGLVRILWFSPVTHLNFGTGELLSLKFNVRWNATIGSDSLRFANGIVADVFGNTLYPQFYNANINITVPPKPILKIGSLFQNTGPSVLIPLSVANFNNIGKYDFTIAYDSRYLNYQNTQDIPDALNLTDTITPKVINDTINSISYKWAYDGLSPYFFGNDSLKNLFNISFAYSGGAHSTEIKFKECTILLPSGNSLEPIIINGGINIITGVKEYLAPGPLYLYQNYPNPFNPSTTIRFEIGDLRWVTLRIFDLLGRDIATLVNQVKSPGTYSVKWNAVNVPSGIYIARIDVGNYSKTIRLLLMK